MDTWIEPKNTPSIRSKIDITHVECKNIFRVSKLFTSGTRDWLATPFASDKMLKAFSLVVGLEFGSASLNQLETQLSSFLQAEANSGDEQDAEARLLSALEAGTYSLQQCSLIIGHLWFVGDMGIRKRILQLLHQKVTVSIILMQSSSCDASHLHGIRIRLSPIVSHISSH